MVIRPKTTERAGQFLLRAIATLKATNATRLFSGLSGKNSKPSESTYWRIWAGTRSIGDHAAKAIAALLGVEADDVDNALVAIESEAMKKGLAALQDQKNGIKGNKTQYLAEGEAIAKVVIEEMLISAAHQTQLDTTKAWVLPLAGLLGPLARSIGFGSASPANRLVSHGDSSGDFVVDTASLKGAIDCLTPSGGFFDGALKKFQVKPDKESDSIRETTRITKVNEINFQLKGLVEPDGTLEGLRLTAKVDASIDLSGHQLEWPFPPKLKIDGFVLKANCRPRGVEITEVQVKYHRPDVGKICSGLEVQEAIRLLKDWGPEHSFYHWDDLIPEDYAGLPSAKEPAVIEFSNDDE